METAKMPTFLSQDTIESRADALRAKASQLTAPIDPAAVARALDVDVYGAVFDDPNVSGVLKSDQGQKSIYVNRSDPRVRQRYTIAHELGHAVFHGNDGDFEDRENDLSVLFRLSADPPMDDLESRSRRRREIQANMFAAALLMPKQLVLDAVANNDDLSDLATIFGVSRSAIGFRIANLGL